MKCSRYTGLILFVGVLSLASCKKWLDVSPKIQIREDDQFSSKQGFIDALFGIYQQTSIQFTYGTNITFGFLDVLAQRYENKSNQYQHWYGQAARYNYTTDGNASQYDVQNNIKNIWSFMYKAIAQANYILENVDAHRDVLAGDAYNIIKGEALGMRAFLHFDLVRMYAPAYLDGANAAEKAIPYMAQFTVVPQERLTVAEVLNKCEQELKEAETLLSVYPDIDQIAGNQGSTTADLFLLYRQNHLNYWAVKAALARLYLYKGDKPNALKYAQEVIDSNKFRFITQGEISTDATTTASDMTFSSEHIFSVYASDLKEHVDIYFKNATATAGDAADLFSTRTKLDVIYEATQAGYGTDVRSPAASKSLWNQLLATVVYTKKYHSDNTSNVKQRIIPVLRLSEMYYIAAEASPVTADGVVYLNTVRTARLIPELSTGISAADLEGEIFKEYRKEFYGEGQLWFYYKRKNTTTIPDGVGNPMTAAKYVFPLPLAEIEFGK